MAGRPLKHHTGHHMGRRLGRKRRKVTLPEGPYVVSNRLPSKAALKNADVAPMEVDNPEGEQGDRIVVMRSTRRDPLAWMHAHGQVNDAQYHGGRDWQRDWETCEQGAQAIDPSKEAVDGGKLADPLSDHRMRASERLKGVAAVITTPDEKKLLTAFLVEGMGIAQIALVYFNRYGAGHERRFGARVKAVLDTLAVFYGYAMPATKSVA